MRRRLMAMVLTLLAGCAQGGVDATRDAERAAVPRDLETRQPIGDSATRLRSRGEGYQREDTVVRDAEGRPRSYSAKVTWPQ